MQIAGYALRRLAMLPLQLLLISVVTFAMVRALPGDPARLELGPLASNESVANLRKALRLDESFFQQYATYLSRLAHGDFGHSWVNGSAVAQDLSARLPAT